MTKAHTQSVIAVYVSDEEKEEIREAAGQRGMSAYLLGLHKDHMAELRKMRKDRECCDGYYGLFGVHRPGCLNNKEKS